MIKSVINEYGLDWLLNRSLYSLKLKIMGAITPTEKLFEKKTGFPKRLDIFHIDVDTLRNFLRSSMNDEEKKSLMLTADKACEGIIKGFSSIELNYGNPIDWQLSPLTGKRCDEYQKWYRISDFDKERGDIKVIWEASRFSHFITLARAYLLTEDERYCKAFSFQLKDWLEKNEYSFGANFKCGQECSLRMVNALLAFTVFESCGVTAPADSKNMKNLIYRCYRKILSNFFYAYKCIKNNHTISELMGMIVGAWCCDDQKQLEKAYRWLDEVVNEQFMDDGGYWQFSFNYQRLALQDLEVVMSISDATGKKLCKYSLDRIKDAAIMMYQCQDESGDMPNYGPNDGALVFPVTSCGYRDFRPVINTAYALTTGRQLYESGKHQEELIWFSGEKTVDAYGVERVERASSQFLDAGLFTIRGQRSWAMIVSNDYHSRPAHMDQLHFDLWVDGVNVFCDSGTYSYASEEGRKLVRNESHNTVVVDGVVQMNSRGSFMIYDWTERNLGQCDDDCFGGSMKSANDYEHVREVRKIGASYEIIDKVNKDYWVIFHTPCEAAFEEGKVVLSKEGQRMCIVRSNGKITVQRAQRSLYYLKKDNINCCIIQGHTGKEINTIIEIIEGENGND